jgi:hypothetical protein
MTTNIIRRRQLRHYNVRPRPVHTWTLKDGRQVCPYCTPRAETCGVRISGFPCGREPGHPGDHIACEGRLHARHWKHRARRAA